MVNSNSWQQKLNNLPVIQDQKMSSRKKKKRAFKIVHLTFLKRRQMVFNTFRSGIFSMLLEKSEGESDELFP